MIDDLQEQSFKESREAHKALKELQASEGWRILCKIAQAQIQSRTDMVILTPRGEMKSEWDQEYKKGEIGGMRFILQIPEVELEQLEAMKDTDNDDANDASDPADDSSDDAE